MPVWLGVLLVLSAAVLAVLLRATRKPRTADEELGRATSGSATSGTATVADVIKMLAKNRATGRLDIAAGERKAAVYLLFGHVFHAEAAGLKGEDALNAALSWPGASCAFNPDAQLPKDETIRTNPAI